MFVDAFVSTVIAKIKEKLDVTKDSVASGAISSMEDYKFVTGKINAYQENIELLKDLYNSFYEIKTISSRRDEYGDELED